MEVFDVFVRAYGPLGLLIAVPVVALFVLWRAYVRREKDHLKAMEEAHARVLAEAQARTDDAKKVTDVLTELVSEQSGLNKETNLMLAHIGSTLDRSFSKGG